MAVQIGKQGVTGAGAGTKPAEKTKAAPKKKGPTRAEKVQAIIAAGQPFTFVEKRKVQSFHCICGAVGQNAIVMHDKNGAEVLAGASCAKKCGVEAPKVRGRKNVEL